MLPMLGEVSTGCAVICAGKTIEVFVFYVVP